MEVTESGSSIVYGARSGRRRTATASSARRRRGRRCTEARAEPDPVPHLAVVVALTEAEPFRADLLDESVDERVRVLAGAEGGLHPLELLAQAVWGQKGGGGALPWQGRLARRAPVLQNEPAEVAQQVQPTDACYRCSPACPAARTRASASPARSPSAGSWPARALRGRPAGDGLRVGDEVGSVDEHANAECLCQCAVHTRRPVALAQALCVPRREGRRRRPPDRPAGRTVAGPASRDVRSGARAGVLRWAVGHAPGGGPAAS